MSTLNKRIGGKVPSQKQINLIKQEKQKFFTPKRIIVFAVVFLVVAVGTAYALKRANDISALKKQQIVTEEELELTLRTVSEYNKVENEYIRYSDAYLSAPERVTLDPRVIIDKIRERIEACNGSYISNISINGNEARVVFYSLNIQEVYDSLHDDPDRIVTVVIPLNESKQTDEMGEYVISNATFRILFDMPKETK